jgi:AcrR family transcriptional regulator
VLAVRLKRDPIAHLEVEHPGVRPHLTQEPEPRDDPVVQIDQLAFGQSLACTRDKVRSGTIVKGSMRRTKRPVSRGSDAAVESPMSGRILRAAFKVFMENGYAAASTLEIASRAKVSKRDLYANFGSKQAVLVACIKSRTARMRLSRNLLIPSSRKMLAATLSAFATNLLGEVCHPTVIAMFRLAIAEATRSPEIAQTLETAGREATRRALADLLAHAQSAGLVGAGEPLQMASQYLALLWEGLMMSLLLGLAAPPKPDEIERLAARATTAFLQLHPEAR